LWVGLQADAFRSHRRGPISLASARNPSGWSPSRRA